MTDDERFSMIIGLIGDPEGVSMNAGYTQGIPRFGVPTLQSSAASVGGTNPGYRPDGKGTTAIPASIVVGSRPQD